MVDSDWDFHPNYFNPMMSPDIPKLRKYVEWVEEQDELRLTQQSEWFQGAYFLHHDDHHYCQTTFCVAGKVANDHGWVPVPGILPSKVTNGGETRFCGDVAAGILGIDVTQQLGLFAGNNTAKDVRRVAESIAGERL